MTTVLVTGVGAVTGYGVLRSLRAQRPDVRLVGTDINDDAVGAHWCNAFTTCPPAAEPDYFDWLRTAIEREDVDLVFPTLDADLDAFRAQAPGSVDSVPSESLGAVIAQNSDTALAVSRDKWALDCRLVAHDDPARIPTSTASDFDELSATLGVPFLLKPRRGYGSRGIVTITDPIEFRRYAAGLDDELIAQRIVGHEDHEYTVGAFGEGHGRFCARIVMRRKLFPSGSTRRAEVIDAPVELDATIERLAPILDPRGPTNLQFRLTEAGWFLLEVNARVSSSTSLREQFGYHEAAMTLDHFLTGSIPAQPEIRTGTVVRYLEDLIVT